MWWTKWLGSLKTRNGLSSERLLAIRNTLPRWSETYACQEHDERKSLDAALGQQLKKECHGLYVSLSKRHADDVMVEGPFDSLNEALRAKGDK